MKNDLNFVYLKSVRNAVIVLDRYGRAMAIKGREVEIGVADGENKDIIRRRLSDPNYQAQMVTEPIGVYREYGRVHRALINFLNWIFGAKTK